MTDIPATATTNAGGSPTAPLGIVLTLGGGGFQFHRMKGYVDGLLDALAQMCRDQGYDAPPIVVQVRGASAGSLVAALIVADSERNQLLSVNPRSIADTRGRRAIRSLLGNLPTLLWRDHATLYPFGDPGQVAEEVFTTDAAGRDLVTPDGARRSATFDDLPTVPPGYGVRPGCMLQVGVRYLHGHPNTVLVPSDMSGSATATVANALRASCAITFSMGRRLVHVFKPPSRPPSTSGEFDLSTACDLFPADIDRYGPGFVQDDFPHIPQDHGGAGMWATDDGHGMVLAVDVRLTGRPGPLLGVLYPNTGRPDGDPERNFVDWLKWMAALPGETARALVEAFKGGWEVSRRRLGTILPPVDERVSAEMYASGYADGWAFAYSPDLAGAVREYSPAILGEGRGWTIPDRPCPSKEVVLAGIGYNAPVKPPPIEMGW